MCNGLVLKMSGLVFENFYWDENIIFVGKWL